jgi:site-specific recombinase XerD
MENQEKRTLDELIAAFQEYLWRTRGTHPDVRRNYARYVRGFIEQVVGTGSVDVRVFSASDVIGFIESLVGRYRPSTIKLAGTALRSFFRFLRVEGLRDDSLDDAVPGVVERRLVGLPRHLEANQLDHLLSSLDRSTPAARRDRAIIVCVARLGLRAGEVVGIRLEDIDWRAGVLHIHTRKTGRGALLPLPVDVGEAIVEYIKNGRPSTRARHVFVLHNLRVGEPATQRTVYDAVKVAIEKAGIDAPICGINLLRHTLATRLIRSGASLKEIADLMGHRSLEATRIYAKLDLDSLRQVAQPWPEVLS